MSVLGESWESEEKRLGTRLKTEKRLSFPTCCVTLGSFLVFSGLLIF